jgi:hypothetical protein
MATGTLMPAPVFTGLDANGNPVAGGLLYTYEAGTTTPATTYSDVGLTVANANPVVLDSAGRATVFLTPGSSYKFLLNTSAGATVWTADNVSAVPTSASSLDVVGTAGTTLAAGQVVYLSDGSGGTTAGRWYLADADQTYSSSLAPAIGIALAALTAGESGTIRTGGLIADLSGLTAGTAYYVSATAGALTNTPPAKARLVGTAQTTTTLLLTPPVSTATLASGTASSSTYLRGDLTWAAVAADIGLASVNDGRLTATAGTPVTTADVSGATSVYFTPYCGNSLALYDGARWYVRTFSEITISLSGFTASRPYDIFAYDNAGAVAIETLVWSSATARATAITRQDGVYVKSGAATRRYLGTVYINSSGGQTDDTKTKRYVYNAQNRVDRALRVIDTTDSWTYTAQVYRQANAAAGNQLEIMVGVSDDAINVTVQVSGQLTSPSWFSVAIGEDSTSAKHADCVTSAGYGSGPTGAGASLIVAPAVGWHRYVWLEYSNGASPATTFYGDNGGAILQAGMVAAWRA